MHFPKYIEFENDIIVIFDNHQSHSNIARNVMKEIKEKPISAGFMCFSLNKEKYFGESTTLNLVANKNLGEKKQEWFGKLFNNGELFFTNNETVARNFGCSEKTLGKAILQDSDGTKTTMPIVGTDEKSIIAMVLFNSVLNIYSKPILILSE